MDTMRKNNTTRSAYTPPQVKRWGTVSDLTRVGATNPGNDAWPGNAAHEPGSVTNSNAGGRGNAGGGRGNSGNAPGRR